MFLCRTIFPYFPVREPSFGKELKKPDSQKYEILTFNDIES